MVSNVKYRSFKDLNVRKRIPFVAMLIIPLVFVLIYLDPPQVLFSAALIYGFSGPAMYFYDKLRGKKRSKDKATDDKQKHSS
jgi:CDP-diacylglycerol--serine O-phosphatidyltransferase